MTRFVIFCLLMVSTCGIAADEPPIVERYLHTGRFDEGEQTLRELLANDNRRDDLRLSLGILQCCQTWQRLAQDLYLHGYRRPPGMVAFIPLTPAANPHPTPISCTDFRRILMRFAHGLEGAEATLAEIEDDTVELTLRLTPIRFDVDRDGESNDEFLMILKSLFPNREFGFLLSNPDFRVKFDRADVAWLQAHCHLVTGSIDLILAFDSQVVFNLYAPTMFSGRVVVKQSAERLGILETRIAEPVRLARARQHFLKMVEFNLQTWDFIEKEVDDDFEWLPSPQQTGVFGEPIDASMILAWRELMAECQRVLKGESSFISIAYEPLNVKKLLDDPPETLNGMNDERYRGQGPFTFFEVISKVQRAFPDGEFWHYVVWFS